MKTIYKIIIFNLIIVLVGCATYQNKGRTGTESFDVHNIKNISKKYFNNHNYVLVFSDALAHSFYYFFDNDRIKAYSLSFDDAKQRFSFKEDKEIISKSLQVVINRIRNNETLTLESTNNCADCYMVTLYKVIDKNGKPFIDFKKIVTQDYIGPIH